MSHYFNTPMFLFYLFSEELQPVYHKDEPVYLIMESKK
jgi:hypothetical protein